MEIQTGQNSTQIVIRNEKEGKDALSKFFPNNTMSKRFLHWLWLVDKENASGLIEHIQWGEFGTVLMYRNLVARLMGDRRRVNRYAIRASNGFILESHYAWIPKDVVYCEFLMQQFYSESRIPRLFVHHSLTAREQLIAAIDLWNEDGKIKISKLKQLKSALGRKQVLDRGLAWYQSEKEEKAKCQFAWDWYQLNHPTIIGSTPLFNSFNDVLAFLDTTSFSQDEKQNHLNKIKSRYRAKAPQDKRKVKKRQTNMSLSNDARTQLDELAERRGMTKTELVEYLILDAYTSGG